MALKTKIASELPEEAVTLSQQEALKHQWNFIKNWPSESEVLFIKFGRHITSATTCFSAFYIIKVFKNILNVNMGRYVLTVIPGVLMPTVITFSTTDWLITDSVLLMKMSCPLCDQLKFAATQYYLGLFFPIFHGYLSFMNYARCTQSYPLPSYKTNPREYWKTSFNIIKQGTSQLKIVGLVQTVIILFLPLLQSKQLSMVIDKFNKEVKEVENNELESGF